MDCMKVLYPSFDFVFLFDHLCGHDQAHGGGMKASIMRKYSDGKQPNMRDTVMLGEDGFLGPYDCILETDNTQHMCWYPDLPDSQLTGTFCISDMEKAEHRHDVFTGKTKPRKLRKMSLSNAYIVQEW